MNENELEIRRLNVIISKQTEVMQKAYDYTLTNIKIPVEERTKIQYILANYVRS